MKVKNTTFKLYLLDGWVNDKDYKRARKRTRRIGVGIERCIYNSTTVDKVKPFLTAQEQKLFKHRLSKMLEFIYP